MSAPSDRELRAALQAGIGRTCGIVSLERRPYIYATSFRLEHVRVTLGDGTVLGIIFKDLSRDSLLPGARRAKPEFLYDPLREIEVYRTVLDSHSMGTAVCHAISVDEAAGRYWLFVEKVEGLELFQVGELEVWRSVAAWLARMHDRFAGTTPRSSRLLNYDRGHFEVWPRRVPARVAEDDVVAVAIALYDAVIDRMVATPATLVHGELYASNVLVDGDGRVCPIDWEMAGTGPGVLDLAALTTGWDTDERLAIARAYHEALAAPPPFEDLLEILECCRLHQSLQWLGWAPGWEPPEAHDHDWLAEARSAAASILKRLGVPGDA